MIKYFLVLVSFLVLQFHAAFCQPNEKIYGITIDGISSLSNIVTSIDNHCQQMTTRIVFDEWQPASGYVSAVNAIHNVSYIMGELLDSYYMNQYSVQQFQSRVDEYVNLLGNKVDIWEVGNEINGEWLGNTDSVVAKLNYSFWYVKKRGKVAAITLYYNYNCWGLPQNEMFRWVNANLSHKLKANVDYVFVSYYEDDCNNFQPNWQRVFDSLHVIFPHSKLGIGECGTSIVNKKADYIYRYYTMHITTPLYVGGYFWWYYRQDCVPWTTKPLWQVLNNAICSPQMVKPGDNQ